MPIEFINLITQGAMAAVFAYLFWEERKERQKMQIQHDQDINRLYNMRINDLKEMARIPTNLEGVPPAHVASLSSLPLPS